MFENGWNVVSNINETKEILSLRQTNELTLFSCDLFRTFFSLE